MPNEIITTIIGNVVADPRLGSYQRRPVCNFTVATTARYYDAEDESWTDGPTTFVQCAQWGNPARNTNKSLTKGTRVIAHGSLFTDTWTDDNDNERLVVKMTVAEVGLSSQFRVISARAPESKKPVKSKKARTNRNVNPVPDFHENEEIPEDDYGPGDENDDDSETED